MTDSYHFESVAKFRVGGVYRNKDGGLVRLRLDKHNPQPGTAWAHLVDTEWGDGFRCLTTGADTVQLEGGVRDLIPGELVQRDGQWVAADSIGPFPSGATLKVAGDKIVGRVEASGPHLMTNAEMARVVLDAFNSVFNGAYNGAVPQRAPLPNSDEWRGIGHKAHDTFGSDFIVTKGEVPTAPLHTSPTTDSAYPAIAGLLRG